MSYIQWSTCLFDIFRSVWQTRNHSQKDEYPQDNFHFKRFILQVPIVFLKFDDYDNFSYQNSKKLNQAQKLLSLKNQIMKSNFLLSFTQNKDQQGSSIKKIHQKDKGSEKNISQTAINGKPRTSQLVKRSSINKQAQKKSKDVEQQMNLLKKKIDQANENIKQTQKKLDIDLFLKQQKQKKVQYAKNINSQYEVQKKKREQQLYNKYRNKEKDQQSSIGDTKNVKSSFPMQLIKILQTQKKSISKSETIISKFIDFQQIEDNPKLLKLLNKDDILNQQNQLLLKDKQYVFKSCKQVSINSIQTVIFPLQIKQSSLQPNEQYQNLMNALTMIPASLCKKYYQSKQIEGNSYVLCKFFYNGIQKSVISNDCIQVKEYIHRYTNVGSRLSDGKSFGPTLLQKCFKKVSCNQQNLDLITAIYSLSGLDPQIIQINNKNYLKQNFIPVLQYLLQTKCCSIGFVNKNNNTSIYTNRIYPLVGIEKIVLLTQKSKKKNKKNKKQNQKQQKPQSNQISQQKIKTVFKFSNPWKGLVLDGKGLNSFEILEMFELFDQIVIIRDYPNNWICKRIFVELFSTGPMSVTNNDWTKNNQYNFTIIKKTCLRIVMRKILQSVDESIIKKDDSISQQNNLYGFLLFTIKDGEYKVTCLKMQALIIKTKSTDINGAQFCTELDRGSYIIIPYSNKISKNSYQFFNLDFFIQKQQAINFGKAVTMDWNWNMINKISSTSDQKYIQSLQGKQVIQKTKCEDVIMNKIFQHPSLQQKQVNRQFESQNLNLGKDLKLSDLIIPGKLSRFLINPQVILQKKGNLKSKISDKIANEKLKSKNNYNKEIEGYQKQQALHILLGYDVLQGQDIDRGKMMEILQNQEDIFDFSNFGLSQEGLTAIMQSLMSYPTIRKLDLSFNDLNDASIVFLCYYLDKANRVQLRELNVSNNEFGKIGKKALQGLCARFQNLQVIGPILQKK